MGLYLSSETHEEPSNDSDELWRHLAIYTSAAMLLSSSSALHMAFQYLTKQYKLIRFRITKAYRLLVHGEEKTHEFYSHVHRGIWCNCCGCQISGIRYKCLNCVKYNLCGICEVNSLEYHKKYHIFAKIVIPLPSALDFPLLEQSYPGTTELEHDQAFNEDDDVASFKVLATDHVITKPVFLKCLGPHMLSDNLISTSLYNLFSEGHTDGIYYPSFINGRAIVDGDDIDEKIYYSFRAYDVQQKGYVTEQDIHNMVWSHLQINKRKIKESIEPGKLTLSHLADSFNSILSSLDTKSFEMISEKSPEAENDDAFAEKEALLNLVLMDLADTITTSAFHAATKYCKTNRIYENEFRRWAYKDDHPLKWLDYAKNVF